VFRRLQAAHKAEGTDPNAREALLDDEYYRGMTAYDQQWQQLSGKVWEENYVRRGCATCGDVAPLPEVPRPAPATANS